jgi:uncharacterized protein YndB with AHSA1/START domain
MSTSYAKAEMLIRRPVSEVFNAFIDPAITTRFWFTKSTGKLEQGKKLEWTWEMYNVSTGVTVKSIEPDKRILIEWGNGAELSTVEWVFKTLANGSTFVSVTNDGLKGSPEEQISKVRDSTEGFTLVLAALKALLEYNIELGLVRDRFPEGIGS